MPYCIVHTLTESQIDQLVALYQPEWWTSHRTREGVVEMLKHSSIVFGAIDADDNLVGFMRLLTDFVYRGTLYDVIVREDLRSHGVSRILLKAVLSHPRCRSIESIDLMCKPEKEGLYAKFGWVTTKSEILTMRRKGGKWRAMKQDSNAMARRARRSDAKEYDHRSLAAANSARSTVRFLETGQSAFFASDLRAHRAIALLRRVRITEDEDLQRGPTARYIDPPTKGSRPCR